MSLKRVSAFALAGLVAAGIAATGIAQDNMMAAEDVVAIDPAIAAMSPEELLELRKDKMREDGSILRSAFNLTGAEAVEAARTLEANFAVLPHLFPEGSIVGDSKALPAIWENWDAFVAIFEKARVASATALTAAEAGDTAAYQTALQPIGEMCGECHQMFRGR